MTVRHLALITVSLGILGSARPALAQRFDIQDGIEVRFDGQCLIDTTTFPGNSTDGLLGCVVNRTDYFAEVWYTVDWICHEHEIYSDGKDHPRNNSKWTSVIANHTDAIFVDICGRSMADRPVKSVRITRVLLHKPISDVAPPPSTIPPSASVNRTPPVPSVDHHIWVRNTCSEGIAVALHYRNTDNVWRTQGWWNIQPGQTMDTGVHSFNSVFYIYASNPHFIWDGRDSDGSLDESVVNDAFNVPNGQQPPGANPHVVSMLKFTADPPDYTRTISCN